jgi:hypothetical protein
MNFNGSPKFAPPTIAPPTIAPPTFAPLFKKKHLRRLFFSPIRDFFAADLGRILCAATFAPQIFASLLKNAAMRREFLILLYFMMVGVVSGSISVSVIYKAPQA